MNTPAAAARAARTCSAVLRSLRDYPERDEAIERLEREIIEDRCDLSLRQVADDGFRLPNSGRAGGERYEVLGTVEPDNENFLDL